MTEPKRVATEFLDSVIRDQQSLGYKTNVSPDRYAESLAALERAFGRMGARRTASIVGGSKGKPTP